jgi:hypothetical protein
VSPENQRLEIAKECGYELLPIPQNAAQKTWQKHGVTVLLPDYLNDLNAMHEAEITLTPDQKMTLITRDCMGDRLTRTHFATAAQRAEAFLRTIGKWEDSA